MKIETSHLLELGKALEAERKRQKLSREEAAAVCGVSASFIRDAESRPENCSLGKLVKLVSGLGLSLSISGWPPVQNSDRETQRADFGVLAERIVSAVGASS